MDNNQQRYESFWVARILFAVGGVFIGYSGSWYLGAGLAIFGMGFVAALDAATTPK